jgi:hypothetical protein
MTKAESFWKRHFAGDADAIVDASAEAVMVYIAGEPSPIRGDIGDALLNFESLKLIFSDLSALEFVPLARDGIFIGWCEAQDCTLLLE